MSSPAALRDTGPVPRKGGPSRVVAWSFSALVGLFILVTAAVLAKDPITTVSLSLAIETVEVTVTDPDGDSTAFRLPRALRADDSRCIEVVEVRPRLGSRVTYERLQRGPLRVIVDGPAVAFYGVGPDRRGEKVEELLVLVLGTPACPVAKGEVVRLPVVGRATFGEAQVNLLPLNEAQLEQVKGKTQFWRPRASEGGMGMAGMLLEGELSVYARAIPDILGIPLRGGPFHADAVYLATAMKLPGGSVVRLDAARRPAGVWAGFADASFADGDPGALRVQASAHTARAQVVLPRGNVVAAKPSEPEEIALSLMARLAGDPNLHLLYGVLLAFAALVSTYAAFIGLYPSKESTHDAESSLPPRPSPDPGWRRRHLDRVRGARRR